MKVIVDSCYDCRFWTEVEIPGIQSWQEVKEWFIKWGRLHYCTHDDETWKEIDLQEDNAAEALDFKCPSSVVIRRPGDEEELDER